MNDEDYNDDVGGGEWLCDDDGKPWQHASNNAQWRQGNKWI